MLSLISIVIYSIVIIVSLILLAIGGFSYDDVTMRFILCMSIIVMLFLFSTNYNDKRFRGKYVRITYLFLLGYIIVFYQKNIDLILGYNDIYDSHIFADALIVKKCFIISLIGLCSFGLGNVISINKKDLMIKEQSQFILNKSYIRLLKSFLVLFILIYLYYTASDILSGNYFYNEETMAENAGSLANYSNVMIYVLVFTLLVINIHINRGKVENASLKSFLSLNGILCNVLLLFYLGLLFMVGDRGPIINILLAYLIAYIVASKKRIKLPYICLIIVVAGIILTSIGEIRRETNKITVTDMMNYSKVENNKSVLHFTEELALSYNTFTYTVNEIPSSHDYFYGLMQLRELAMSVPFLHRLVPFVYSEKSYENSSTDYCSYLIQGLNRTYGNGTSLLANIYMDFGVWGIIVVMFLLGRIMYRLDWEIYEGNNIYWNSVAIIVFSFSLYLSRASLTTPVYYILPSLLILYMGKYFNSAKL